MSKRVLSVDDYGNLASSDAQQGFQMVNYGARTSLLKDSQKAQSSTRSKSMSSKMSLANLLDNEEVEGEKKNIADIDKTLSIESILHEILFPGNHILLLYYCILLIFTNTKGLPEHYPLRKKIAIAKINSFSGTIWDLFQILFIGASMFTYILGTYEIDWYAQRCCYITEIVMTQFFLIDFILNFLVRYEAAYFYDIFTIIDILTMLPIYVSFDDPKVAVAIDFMRCLRMLRLMRIFKSFRLVRNLSGVNRQVLILTLTLITLIFMAAGIVQLMENDIKQMHYDCQYINEYTNWKPSCSDILPYTDTSISSWCDCETMRCHPKYIPGDINGEPSKLYCMHFSFFNTFYYIIVTIFSVGYGDITPDTLAAKGVVIALIITTLIIIPMRLSELQSLLSLTSPYSAPYVPQNNENHVIVCGYTSDKKKLERFLKEFFHPDRSTTAGQEYHAVILSQDQPSADIRSVLLSQGLESKCTCVVGSALSIGDLRRVKAESAVAIFFLCNSDADEEIAPIQDSANIIRALSVCNFNNQLDCFVQVLRPEDRTILKDSDVDVILCLDEFKTALQARNAVCPGFSTFIENIFHSFGSVDPEIEAQMAKWYKEYLHGAGMELYFVQLPQQFIKAVRYNYRTIAEAIFCHFHTIVLGLCDKEYSALVFNPNSKDVTDFTNITQFFAIFNVALIIADDQHKAEHIASSLSNELIVQEILYQLHLEEMRLPCKSIRKKTEDSDNLDYSDYESEEDSEDEADEDSYIGYARNAQANTLYDEHEQDRMANVRDDGAISRRISKTVSTRSIALTGKKQSSRNLSRQISTINTNIKRIKEVDSDEEEKEDNNNDEDMDSGKSGYASRIMTDAKNLSGHVIVYGCDANLLMFISELRRPAVRGDTYHPILIISENTPTKWDYIRHKYNDIYFMKGQITKMETFARLNIDEAFSLILLASRNDVMEIDDEHINASTLFTYLKLESHIPKDVFFTVELNSSSNMAVLNATIMRRARLAAVEAKAQLLLNGVAPLIEKSLNEGIADGRTNSVSNRGVRKSVDSKEKEKSPSSTTTTANVATLNSTEAERKESNVARRGSVLFDGNGRFATKRDRSVLIQTGAASTHSRLGNLNGVSFDETKNEDSDRKNSVALSVTSKSIERISEAVSKSDILNMLKQDEELWDAMDSHHVLPVFASARAFVPSSFESLLVQSFYIKLTPMICDKLVCGQLAQTVMQIDVPYRLLGSTFFDLFRIFINFQVLCFGIYRAPQKQLGSTLPYVYTSPPKDCVLSLNDRVYVFGTCSNTTKAVDYCNKLNY